MDIKVARELGRVVAEAQVKAARGDCSYGMLKRSRRSKGRTATKMAGFAAQGAMSALRSGAWLPVIGPMLGARQMSAAKQRMAQSNAAPGGVAPGGVAPGGAAPGGAAPQWNPAARQAFAGMGVRPTATPAAPGTTSEQQQGYNSPVATGMTASSARKRDGIEKGAAVWPWALGSLGAGLLASPIVRGLSSMGRGGPGFWKGFGTGLGQMFGTSGEKKDEPGMQTWEPYEQRILARGGINPAQWQQEMKALRDIMAGQEMEAYRNRMLTQAFTRLGGY